MQIITREHSGKMLPSKYFALGYTEQSEFYLTIGKEYTVFAIALWRSTILFLICDDYDLPSWHPAELFSISQPRMPDNWLFSTSVANEHGVEALWGYERLAIDPSHYEALLERDPVALGFFHEEKLAQESGRRS
jgi:hypothetical protein